MSAGAIRSRSKSARYGARDPLLAPWPLMLAYGAWRLITALMRPVLFLTLLAIAAVLAYRGLEAAPAPVLQDARPLSARIDAAFQASVPSGDDPLVFWAGRIDAALDAPARSAADIALARSYAQALTGLAGRDPLAMDVLGEGRGRAHLEADLRARPAWRRDQILQQALQQRLDAGRAAGLDPAELVFAPQRVRTRFARAARLFDRALSAADRWFLDPDGRAVSLSALPGLVHQDLDGQLAYGDARDVVVQGCAFARQHSLRIDQCRVGFIPKPQADAPLAGLALAMTGADTESAALGARLAFAARLAGRLDDDLARQLTLGPDPALGEEALLAAAMPVLTNAGAAFTQPVRSQASLRAAAREYAQAARLDAELRRDVFDGLAGVRRADSALTAIRVADVLRAPGDGARLAALADAADGRLLALHDLFGRDMLALAEPPQRREFDAWPQSAQRNLIGAAACAGLALALVFGAVVAGWRRRSGAPPGLLERIDAAATQLILGRNV